MGRRIQGTGAKCSQIQPDETGRGSTAYQELEVSHVAWILIKTHSLEFRVSRNYNRTFFEQTSDSCALPVEKEFRARIRAPFELVKST